MTNAKNALKKMNNLPKDNQETVRSLLMAMKEEIKNALPTYVSADKFIRTALTAINTTPKLANCSKQSLLAAIMNSAQLGLEFNTPLGESYLIPYGNKVNFQIGYQGLLKLAYNSGQFKRITAREVRENEQFSIDYGTGQINHMPTLVGDSGAVIGYYALYQTKDGGQDVFYMSKADATNYGKTYSKSFYSGPWKDNFDAMAKKSCLIQVLKYAPKALESRTLFEATKMDNANINDFMQENDKNISFDIDYEIEEQAEKEEKVDKNTGEILDNPSFFDQDFKAVEQ